MPFFIVQFTFLILISTMSFAGCIPVNEAGQHVGETRCVKGKIIHVDQSEAGLARLSFCGDIEKCAFVALVAATDQENVSALKEMQGRVVKIHGLLEEVQGHAQMVIRDSQQLLADDSGVPSFMKTYDVEERWHYSAGTSHARRGKRSTTKKQTAFCRLIFRKMRKSEVGVPLIDHAEEQPVPPLRLFWPG